MTYKTWSSDLLFQIYIDGVSKLLQFRESIYKTKDEKTIKACDEYIEKAQGSIESSPEFLSLEEFDGLAIPNELLSISTERYGDLDVYVPVSYITEIYEYLKTLK